MTLTIALQLLGFLSPDPTGLLEIGRAKAACIQTLGLPEGASDDALLLRLNAVLRQRGLPAVGDVGNDALLGGVITRAQADATPLVVEVRRCGLRGEAKEALASAPVTPYGQVALRFAPGDAALVMVVIRAGAKELHRSDPMSVERSGWFAWSESGEPVSAPSRFEVRDAYLSSLLAPEKLRLADLAEVSDRGAVVMGLVSLTGLPLDVVKQHVIAAHLARAEELGVDPVIVDALLGPPGQHRSVHDDELVSTVRRRALPPVPSPEVTPADVDEARRRALGASEAGEGPHVPAAAVRALRAKAVPVADRTVGKTTWRALLEYVGVPDTLVANVAEHLHADREAEAWSLVAAELEAAAVGKARALFDLAALVGHEPTMMSSLRGRTARAIARMAASELKKLVTADGHVADVHGRADREYPGDALLRRRRDRLSEPTRRFVDTHGEKIDLGAMPVRDMVAELGHAGAPLDETSIQELSTMQRVLKVAGDASVATALLDAGYESAQEIAFAALGDLVSDLGKRGVDAATAKDVYRRARGRYRAAVERYLQIDPTAAGAHVAALGSRDAARGMISVATYAHLFGSQDYGRVEEWESVTGQPAYFVDLMVWLSRAPTIAGVTRPYDALLARRKDLKEIVLDKRNAETSVPHIDLVCELLEDGAAVRLGLPESGTRQTTRSADEIRAYPEHVNGDVYDALAKSSGTMRLPFDLATEEMRAYLRGKQVREKPLSRQRLLETLGARLFGDDAQRLAAEVLGINATDFAVLTTPKPDAATQEAIWGSATIEGLDVFLRRAPALGKARGHLGYDEALSLLATRFVDPRRVVQQRLADGITVDRCKADQRVFVPALSSEILDRAHRMLRLARAIPVPLGELDALVEATGSGLDANGLVSLAALRQCQAALGLTTEEVAALFRDFVVSDIDHRPDGSLPLYRRIFLRRAEAGAIPRVFLDPAAAPSALKDHDARICAALGIPSEQFAALCATAKVVDANVSFASLSALFRHVRLASAVARVAPAVRSFDDYAELLAFAGDPLDSVRALAAFLERASRLSAAELSIADARVLAGSITPSGAALADLEAGLVALRAQTRVAVSQAGTTPVTEPAVTTAILDGDTWTPLVAGWAGVDLRSAPALLAVPRDVVTALVDPAAAPTSRTGAAHAVARLALAVAALRLAPADAPRLAPVLTATLVAPSPDALDELLRFTLLAKRLSPSGSLADYVHDVSTGTPTPEVVAGSLARATGLDAKRTEASWTALDTATSSPLDAALLARVLDLTEASLALGVPTKTIADWMAVAPTSDSATALRNAIRGTLPWASWLVTSRAVQDALRERKRDALVDFIIATPRPGTANPDAPEPTSVHDFGGRYLLDVEMGDCRDTTRIVQAASAVQNLVQRCLLGLESTILDKPSDKDGSAFWRQWDWRSRYRLWEANRRIFLYPEEFMTVANRPETSPLFLDFEKKVSESEITEGSVAAALEDYLVALEKISRLDYAALDVVANPKPEKGEVAGVMGAVASAAGTPATHYYRQFKGGRWFPWEEVSLGPSTTSLALGQGLTRAWVVWPTSTDHVHPAQTLPKSELNGGVLGPEHGGKGLSYVRYSWSIRDDRGVWSTPKTTSRAVLMTPRDRRGFVLSVKADDPSPYVMSLFLATGGNSVQAAVDDGTTPLAKVFYTSAMQVARDATRSYVNPKTSFGAEQPNKKTWGEHYTEHTLSRPIVEEPAQLTAWLGMTFDGNRMVIGTNDADLDLRVPVTTPPASVPVATRLLKALTPITVTIPRAVLGGDAGITRPRPDAFAVNGTVLKEPDGNARAAIWSCMAFSPLTLSKLVAPEVLTSIGLPAKTFLMVPGYHPFASELLAYVRRAGLRKMYQPDLQNSGSAIALEALQRPPLDLLTALDADATNVAFLSNGKAVVRGAGTALEGFDFDSLAPYAGYNWELFFWAPIFVALRLGSVQRFREAQAFYHFVFNPLTTDHGESPARFWVTRPFRTAASDTDVEVVLQQSIEKVTNPFQIIEQSPFDPHGVAAGRPSAKQKFTVRGYLDNLIAWGDHLYRSGTRQNSREDVDEAAQVYELAQTILGDAPNQLRQLGEKRTRAFGDASDWLGGSNILVELENTISDAGLLDEGIPLVHLPVLTSQGAPVKSLYFRVPANQSLLDYWERVDGRLESIRACKTIDGAVVSLPLAGARIDPRALADAAALGVSVADAIAMATGRPPQLRFKVMLGRAREACEEARQLGALILAMLEKRDGEHVAIVRSQYEEPIVRAARQVKVEQQAQSDKEVSALEKSGDIIVAREKFFTEREYMNDLEKAALALSVTAGILEGAGAVLDLASGGIQLIPDVTIGINGFGGTPAATVTYGGSPVAGSLSKWATGLSKLGGLVDRIGGIVSTQAGYARRKEEWEYQGAQATLEKTHLDEQIAAARLRKAIFEAELVGQDAQEKAWAQSDRMLREKFTNRELYIWHIQRLMELYRRAWDQAMHLAGVARECFAFEAGDNTIMRPDAREWDATKAGLLAGDGLQRYLRDLDMQYVERRLFERVITQHVSLRQVAPAAYAKLVSGSNTGSIIIPAWWFTRLYPGVHRRRIRTVSVTIPCVAGSNANVNATVRLVGSSHAISLSSGINDPGWDMSTRAEAYVPFEGVSLDQDTEWTVSFPLGGTDVDVATIADVIFHIEYAADEGEDAGTQPAELTLFVDVARSAPDAWSELVNGEAHTSTFDIGDLLPRFLTGYELEDLEPAIAIDADGHVVANGPQAELGDGKNQVRVKATDGATDLRSLRHLLLVLKVKRKT